MANWKKKHKGCFTKSMFLFHVWLKQWHKHSLLIKHKTNRAKWKITRALNKQLTVLSKNKTNTNSPHVRKPHFFFSQFTFAGGLAELFIIIITHFPHEPVILFYYHHLSSWCRHKNRPPPTTHVLLFKYSVDSADIYIGSARALTDSWPGIKYSHCQVK